MIAYNSCINHQNYFQTSKGHITWVIYKVNRIPMHCGVGYERVHFLDRGQTLGVGQLKNEGHSDSPLQIPEPNSDPKLN